MAYLYILQSKRNGKYYIGSTAGAIESRVKRHQRGEVSFTSKNLPIELVLAQKCPNIKVAREIEKKLKRFKRKDYIKKIVLEGRIRLLERIEGSDVPPKAGVGVPTTDFF